LHPRRSLQAKIKCRKCGAQTKQVRAIEGGHVFKLGAVYSRKMRAYFVDRDGRTKPVIMGCYGIGLGRLMATIVEVYHDKRGIIWPASVAPYQVHLVGVNLENREVRVKSGELYKVLLKAKIEVLYDDREKVAAGVKFNDADLIGIPIRLVISEETLKKDSVEWKKRNKTKTELVRLSQVVGRAEARDEG